MSPRMPSAVDERDRLDNELANLIEARDAAAARCAELRTQISQRDGQGAAANVAAVRSGELGASFGDTNRAGLVADLEQQTAAVKSLGEAAAAIPREVAELHRTRWDEFAEHAEGLTQRAIAAVAQVEAAYREAHRAWRDAEQTWATPMGDLDARRDQENLPGHRSEAVGQAGERTVPAWPLPHPDAFNDATRIAPRPLGYVPPKRRGDQNKPGNFRDANHPQTPPRLIENPRANVIYTTCDKRGFARYVRDATGDVAGR